MFAEGALRLSKNEPSVSSLPLGQQGIAARTTRPLFDRAAWERQERTSARAEEEEEADDADAAATADRGPCVRASPRRGPDYSLFFSGQRSMAQHGAASDNRRGRGRVAPRESAPVTQRTDMARERGLA